VIYYINVVSIISILISNAVLANSGHQIHDKNKTTLRGFYFANFSKNYNMDITYESCKTRNVDCKMKDISVPNAKNGENMVWVYDAFEIFSVKEIDENGNIYSETTFPSDCTAYSKDNFKNMVALIDIPGTKMVSCLAMLTHDPAFPDKSGDNQGNQ
jgi:hypothetical protein